ncbi:DNA-methyltransferase [Undibacterium sp. Ren11W]|uniref:DNA-methyltransferase n=1 Tax=Undibacterium sp. Ren11W TaxID=3413045 RepID=UPI003BEF8498
MSSYINTIFNEDAVLGLARIPDGSIDLILTDPPYSLGKDYGNDSDKQAAADYLAWTARWIQAALPKLKPNGSLYIFLTWRYSPEIFVMLKQHMIMLNEIIWDRRVPSMGGSVRSFSSVHDTIGFFAKAKGHYFDLDAVRIPYDAATKKARSRAIFVGAKWLELGYNPKDLWSVSRIHKENPERADHPTQKPLEIIERMLLASCPPDGIVLDLFMGSGTTAVAAKRCGRNFVGFELNADYCDIIQRRLASPESLRVERSNQPSEPIRAKVAKVSGLAKAKRGRKSLKKTATLKNAAAAKKAVQVDANVSSNTASKPIKKRAKSTQDATAIGQSMALPII